MGYSLMELAVGLSAGSILMAGVGSTIYVASKATSVGDQTTASLVASSMTAEQVGAELQYAIDFNERSPTAVEFTIADRDGDAAAETVRYQWSGTAGDPITRKYNGGVAQPVLADVHLFDLQYRVNTVTQTAQSSSTSESAETLLASFDGWSGVSASEYSRSLSSTTWASECFTPTWPNGAQQLKITRVRVKMSKIIAPGDCSVGIYPASGGVGPAPAAAPIGTPQTVSGAGLTITAQWQDIAFSDVTLSDTSAAYNIVVKGVGSGAQVSYLTSSLAPADSTVYKYTTNSGSTWYPSASQEKNYDMPFYVYGTYVSSQTQQTPGDRYFVRSVGISLQASADAADRIDTAAEVLNAPEVTSP